MANLIKVREINEILNTTNATLVAVTKNQPIEAVQKLYDFGLRVFGENRVQDLLEKAALFPPDVQWHLIGHLQRNKVKYIAPFISLIHSVDSLSLLEEINKQAQKNGRIIDFLLQFFVAEEESKFGLSWEEALELLNSKSFQEMQHVRMVGVMGMASFIDNQTQIRQEFKVLKGYFEALKIQFFKDDSSFKEISMGMSGDYPIALEEGSTMLRIGSLLFAN